MSSHKSSWSQEVFDRSGSQWALKSFRSQNVCCPLRDWVSSGKSCRLLVNQRFNVCRSGWQWALIRAPDHNMFVGRSGSQWALIRAPDRKTFLIDWESLSSDKSSWSREVCLSIRESKKSAKRFCRLNRDLMDLLIGVTMSSDKSSRSQQVCWSIRESMSSDKSSRSQQVCWSIRESMSSDKSPWSQEDSDRPGSQ